METSTNLELRFMVRDNIDPENNRFTVIFHFPRGCGKEYAEQAIDKMLKNLRIRALEMHEAYTEGRKPTWSDLS